MESNDHSSYNLEMGTYVRHTLTGSNNTWETSSGTNVRKVVRIDKIHNINPNYKMIRSLGYFLPPASYEYLNSETTVWSGWSRQSITYADSPSYNQDIRCLGLNPNVLAQPSQTYDDLILASPEELLSADKKARMRLFAAIKNQRINLGILMAERNKTVATFAGLANRILGAYKAFKKGKFKQFFNQFSSLTPKQLKNQVLRKKRRSNRRKETSDADELFIRAAEDWLTIQYGIKPVLNDIYGAAEKLAEYRFAGERACKAEGSASFSYLSQTETPYEVLRDPIAGKLAMHVSGRCTTKYTAYFRIDLPIAPELSELGLTNPAAILWEVVPFSFVIDWFIPVGSWIQNFDATMGVHWVDGCKTVFVKQSVRRTSSANAVREQYAESGEAFGLNETVRMRRDLLAEFPNLPLPSFKSPVSYLHIANATALFVVLTRK